MDAVAFYGSPSEKGCTSFDNLDSVLGEIHKKQRDHVQHTLWLTGDFNLPDVNWENHLVMAGATRACQSEVMLEICHKYNLGADSAGTYKGYANNGKCVGSIFFTSNASLINSISVTPGFGDHFAVLADSSLKPEVHKKPPRKIFQYGKAKNGRVEI